MSGGECNPYPPEEAGVRLPDSLGNSWNRSRFVRSRVVVATVGRARTRGHPKTGIPRRSQPRPGQPSGAGVGRGPGPTLRPRPFADRYDLQAIGFADVDRGADGAHEPRLRRAAGASGAAGRLGR